MVNKEKLKELFSYHPTTEKEREEKHEKMNQCCCDFALSLSDIISNPAELTVLLRKIQEIRMLGNQAIAYDSVGLSYREIFEK